MDMSTMSMDMSSPTTTSSSSTATSTSSMDMSSSSSDSTTMQMSMIFFSSPSTPLYSTAWTPSSTATYALTCLFLILLSILFRSLMAFKVYVETRWAHDARRRRYIVVVDDGEVIGVGEEGYRDEAEKERLTGTLTARGVDEKVRIVEAAVDVGAGTWMKPWRLSVDLPRALLYTVIVGIGYLEMLAVMTMNIGYFASVLGGAFLGELFVGRYVAHMDTHH